MEAANQRPRDNFNMVYIILLIHGIGTLMPWNMFINAQEYFRFYKLDNTTLGLEPDEQISIINLKENFISYLSVCSQVPNFVFNGLNLITQFADGYLKFRVNFALAVEASVFAITIILAYIDTSKTQIAFFYTTMILVVLLNMANGIYQNCIFGTGAKFPSKYTNAILIGSNLSGTFTATVNLITIWASPDPVRAAIAYFVTALFIIVSCIVSFNSLPLIPFYQHYNSRASKKSQSSDDEQQHELLERPQKGQETQQEQPKTESPKLRQSKRRASKAEQSKQEASEPEQPKQEASEPEQSKREASEPEQPKREASEPEQSKQEASKAEQSKQKATRSRQSKQRTLKSEQSKQKASKAEQSKQEASKQVSERAPEKDENDGYIEDESDLMKKWRVLKMCWPQFLNVFLVFYVTLASFPAVLADITQIGGFFSNKYFVSFACFFIFNLFAMLGNLISNYTTWPGKERVWIPVVSRFIFIPFFLFCNYLPHSRKWTVLISNDFVYIVGNMLFALSSGYLSSLCMMFASRDVRPELAPKAGMLAAFFLVLGIFLGVNSSFILRWLVK